MRGLSASNRPLSAGEIGRLGEEIARVVLQALGVEVTPTPSSGSRGSKGDLRSPELRVEVKATFGGDEKAALRAAARALRDAGRYHGTVGVLVWFRPQGGGVRADVHEAACPAILSWDGEDALYVEHMIPLDGPLHGVEVVVRAHRCLKPRTENRR